MPPKTSSEILAAALSTAARHIGQAIPGLASGALTGLMTGGPIGALIGAGAGLGTGLAGSIGREVRGPGGQVLQTIGNLGQTAMGLFGGGKGGPASGLLSALPGVISGGRGGQSGNPLAGLLGPMLGGGRLPQSGATGSVQPGSAAQQLLALLGRPEILQALSSSMLGSMGRQTIPIAAQTVAGRQPLTQVPTGAILGVLGQQVQEALDEWSGHAAEAPNAHDYLLVAQRLRMLIPPILSGVLRFFASGSPRRNWSSVSRPLNRCLNGRTVLKAMKAKRSMRISGHRKQTSLPSMKAPMRPVTAISLPPSVPEGGHDEPAGSAFLFMPGGQVGSSDGGMQPRAMPDLDQLMSGLDPRMRQVMDMMRHRQPPVIEHEEAHGDSIQALLKDLRPISLSDPRGRSEPPARTGRETAHRTVSNDNPSDLAEENGHLRDDRLWLEAVNDRLSLALGACRQCWGHNPECRVCVGSGAPGWMRPDPVLFRDLIVPAARSTQTVRQQARPHPQAIRTGSAVPPSDHIHLPTE